MGNSGHSGLWQRGISGRDECEQYSDRLCKHEACKEGEQAPDAHTVLSVVSTLALLQTLEPDRWLDTVTWSDIFSDRRFYRTDRVEALGVTTR